MNAGDASGLRLRANASELVRLAGFIRQTSLAAQTFAVGGFLRDSILGLPSHDIDLVVEAPGGARCLAEELSARFPETFSGAHEMGRGYPIWQIVDRGNPDSPTNIEIADTQAEMFPDPETRARQTVFGSLREDSERRDFTTNMLYWSFGSGEFRDVSGVSATDIKTGRLRVHPSVDPVKIFSDDPLRILRGFRFKHRFGWALDEATTTAMHATASRISILSPERIRDELFKMSERETFGAALEDMRKLGILDLLLPELSAMPGCGQDRIYHSEGDVWTHTLLVMRAAPTTPELQWAALLHDVGKPPTREVVGERVKFLGHEKVSASIARALFQRLRVSREFAERVERLILLHLRGGDVELWKSLKPARKLLREVGVQKEELLQLIEADSRSSLGADGEPRLTHLPVLHERLREAELIPLSTHDILSGKELMDHFQRPGGPWIRELKARLQELEDDAAAAGRRLTREEALAFLEVADSGADGPGSAGTEPKKKE